MYALLRLLHVHNIFRRQIGAFQVVLYHRDALTGVLYYGSTVGEETIAVSGILAGLSLSSITKLFVAMAVKEEYTLRDRRVLNCKLTEPRFGCIPSFCHSVGQVP